jgi:hypothetical protein
MDIKEQVKILVKENRAMKEELSQLKGEKMKEAVNLDANTQAPATGASATGAAAQPQGATQDSMDKKYEEAQTLDKNTQAPATGAPATGATETPKDVAQDDMSKKYQENEKSDDAEEPEEKGDMAKMVEILEAFKAQLESQGKEIATLKEEFGKYKEAAPAKVDDEQKPEAPLSEKLYSSVAEKPRMKECVNVLKML